jgi:hypothetical protein
LKCSSKAKFQPVVLRKREQHAPAGELAAEIVSRHDLEIAERARYLEPVGTARHRDPDLGVPIHRLDAESARDAGRQCDHFHAVQQRPQVEKRGADDDRMGSGRREEGIVEQRIGIELLIEPIDPKRSRPHRLAAKALSSVERGRNGRHDRDRRPVERAFGRPVPGLE